MQLYQRCSFTFHSFEDLRAFARKVPLSQVARVSELRLSLRMGSGGDDLGHHNPELPAAIACRFAGLRKMHASLQLRFYNVRHLRECIRTDWKLAHWARGLLNFACQPLDEATVMLENDDIHRITNSQMMAKHNPQQEELQDWARQIQNQLLASWGHDAAVAFLQRHQKMEDKYHKKRCGSHWDFEPLKPVSERVP